VQPVGSPNMDLVRAFVAAVVKQNQEVDIATINPAASVANYVDATSYFSLVGLFKWLSSLIT
jgi:hypothetical protein